MSKAQRSQDLNKRRVAAAVVAQSLDQARQRFAALQQAAPAAGQGMSAVNAHAQQVNAASVRIQQLESAYKQTFGFMPAELEKLGVEGLDGRRDSKSESA